MAERLTWKEIVEKYPNRWVGLTDVERDAPDDPNIKSAVVKYTDKTMHELLQIQFHSDNFLSIFTTPDEYEPFIGLGWMIRNAAHNS